MKLKGNFFHTLYLFFILHVFSRKTHDLLLKIKVLLLKGLGSKVGVYPYFVIKGFSFTFAS
jgi:hypothetical protein